MSCQQFTRARFASPLVLAAVDWRQLGTGRWASDVGCALSARPARGAPWKGRHYSRRPGFVCRLDRRTSGVVSAEVLIACGLWLWRGSSPITACSTRRARARARKAMRSAQQSSGRKGGAILSPTHKGASKMPGRRVVQLVRVRAPGCPF
jgi:hypothetical protein